MELVLNIVSGFCLLTGSFLIFSGALGVIRFPDFYTRMHAAGVTETLAAGLILVGLMLIAGWGIVLAKLVLILLFILITSPTASHALGKAAWKAGLKPVVIENDKQQNEL
ncbi:monovalent cation/H(+) antiporter subunit G [Pleionea litopenaei]|uniref:Monovalent cation/H(+) antiporter subunit G n=1 Tax=Pleionea litopenaei TaxID=3070815 RepID=A0AA51RUD9_9GAMM|nr:monovalent cation/H(+) antiporter subunit G [Pleionea sp. HL-JVS1]WMS87843.1 monovalent cation/H(+) antiporter subunit G [Pleionea sp. HL-JVS1]